MSHGLDAVLTVLLLVGVIPGAVQFARLYRNRHDRTINYEVDWLGRRKEEKSD